MMSLVGDQEKEHFISCPIYYEIIGWIPHDRLVHDLYLMSMDGHFLMIKLRVVHVK